MCFTFAMCYIMCEITDGHVFDFFFLILGYVGSVFLYVLRTSREVSKTTVLLYLGITH